MKLSKIYFMARRLLTDLVENIRVETEVGKSATLEWYYIRFSEEKINSRGGNKAFHFDDQGVPLIHSYIDVEEKGYYYYPITIGQYALALFHEYLNNGNLEKKSQFMRIADWFASEVRYEDGAAIWLSDVPKPEFRMHSPWKSAFSQSRGLSVLLRAWQITGKSAYLEICKAALIPFTRDVKEGGVRIDKEIDRVFYEEYVAEGPTRILDGHMFSLFGVYDFIRAVDPEVHHASHLLASKIFDEGINGLIKWLPDFDMGYWVHYNKCDLPFYPKNDPCTLGYLRLVIVQLEILYKITGRQELSDYVDKFKGYIKWRNILKMYRLKFTALTNLNRI